MEQEKSTSASACVVCKAHSALRCENCTIISMDRFIRDPKTSPPYYCGKEHQLKHWRSGHKTECGSIREAKYRRALKHPSERHCNILYFCTMKNILPPKDPSDADGFNENVLESIQGVRDDYGLSNCSTIKEEYKLMNLYEGLLKILQCDLDDLHKACMNGELAEIIKQEYEFLPRLDRGGYYHWFLQNQHIVNNKYTKKANLLFCKIK